jgi:hypothetical protein
VGQSGDVHYSWLERDAVAKGLDREESRPHKRLDSGGD